MQGATSPQPAHLCPGRSAATAPGQAPHTQAPLQAVNTQRCWVRERGEKYERGCLCRESLQTDVLLLVGTGMCSEGV